jgi:hypothetical protein
MKHLVPLCVIALLVASVAAQAITIPEGPVEPFIGTVYSPYLVPFALSDLNFDAATPGDNVNYGETETLKYDYWYGLLGPANFVILDIAQTNSDAGIRDCLAFRSGPVPLSMADYRGSYPGSKVGTVNLGMTDRLTYTGPYDPTVADNNSFDTEFQDGQFDAWVNAGYPLDSRMMIAPVIQDVAITGSQSVQIVGFAAFYVDSYSTVKGEKVMEVRFTSMPEEAIVTPEPSSLLALFTGIGGLGGLTWRRKK